MLLYIHIPFCVSKCGYCGFNSLTNMLNFKQKYLDCLCADLKNELDSWDNLSLGIHSADLLNFERSQTPSLVSRPKFSKNYESNTANTSIVDFANRAKNAESNSIFCHSLRSEESKNSPSLAERISNISPSLAEGARGWVESKKFHSIYIGGGTPNTLTPRDYEQIFRILEPRIAPNTEITMELNPNASSMEMLKDFKDLGINRFSIGVQSFCVDKLKLLERNHSPKIAQKFIENALSCDVRVSIDLIYGTILDSSKSLRFELESALNLGVGHISCYALSIDKNSAFFTKGKNPTRESSLCYELKAILESSGFMQYEVSNFAHDKTQKSLHNLGYWAYRDYIGVGLGAVGKITDLQGDSKIGRIYKQNDFGAYLANPLSVRQENLNIDDIRLEKIFLGLRSEVGVESTLIANKERLNLLMQSDKIYAKNGKIYATNYFIADEIVLWLESQSN